MSDELKPVNCGCGGEAVIYVTHWWGKCFVCECEECGTASRPCTTEAEAVGAWNRAMKGNAEEKLKAFWDGMSAEMKDLPDVRCQIGVGMSDLIDRKAVLDKFSAMCEVCGKGEKYNGVMCRCCALDDAIAFVEDIPSAEPERKWILVTEALPQNYEQIICIDTRGKMMIGVYGEYGWTFPCYMTEPVAWMPLPEPWRGEK